MKSIYDLKLNETLIINKNTSVMRVPGGWIYLNENTSCFVPLNNEFYNFNTNIKIDKMIKYVEYYFNLPEPIKTSKSREGYYPTAKKILSKLIIDNTKTSKTEIAEYLNYNTRTSVVNALSAFDNLLFVNDKIIEHYNIIKDKLNLK